MTHAAYMQFPTPPPKKKGLLVLRTLQYHTCYLLYTWHFLSEMPPHSVFTYSFHIVVVVKPEAYFLLEHLPMEQAYPQWIETSVMKGSETVLLQLGLP